jgi:hypothetical protein
MQVVICGPKPLMAKKLVLCDFPFGCFQNRRINVRKKKKVERERAGERILTGFEISKYESWTIRCKRMVRI